MRGDVIDSARHRVPDLIHFAAVNALDDKRAENDRVPIDGGTARHRNVRARVID
jgi:hypothetical protein